MGQELPISEVDFEKQSFYCRKETLCVQAASLHYERVKSTCSSGVSSVVHIPNEHSVKSAGLLPKEGLPTASFTVEKELYLTFFMHQYLGCRHGIKTRSSGFIVSTAVRSREQQWP